MKSREFWVDKFNQASILSRELDRRADKLTQEIILKTSIRKGYQDRRKLDQLRSKLAHLVRGSLYQRGRMVYYEERVVALENRSRFDRILRSPVI
jgi:hypothetical protein